MVHVCKHKNQKFKKGEIGEERWQMVLTTAPGPILDPFSNISRHSSTEYGYLTCNQVTISN